MILTHCVTVYVAKSYLHGKGHNTPTPDFSSHFAVTRLPMSANGELLYHVI